MSYFYVDYSHEYSDCLLSLLNIQNNKKKFSILFEKGKGETNFIVFRINKTIKSLLCVFTFWAPCCDVRYDFRIKMMFCSSLPPVVCRGTHVLFTLFVFVCEQWFPTRIVMCVCFVFLRLVYPMLLISLDCPCYDWSFVLCTLCCWFLWIVHVMIGPSSCVPYVADFSGLFMLWLALRNFLTFT
jgi:hypothetical protein